MSMEEGRLGGAKKLLVGAVYGPLLLIGLLVLSILLLVVWIANTLWLIATGDPLTSQKTRIGYYWWWSTDRLQYLATGRGSWEWRP